MQPAHKPIVVVPARNEEDRLPAMLAALMRQTVLASLPDPLDVVVVLNNTDDQSEALAEQAVAAEPQLRLAIVNVQFPPRAGSCRICSQAGHGHRQW